MIARHIGVRERFEKVDRVNPEAESLLPRSKIKGYVYRGPHAPVCYFSTHTGPAGAYFNVLSWTLLCEIPSFPSPRVPDTLGSSSSCPPSLFLISFVLWHKNRYRESQLATPSVPWSLDGAFRHCTSWDRMIVLPALPHSTYATVSSACSASRSGHTTNDTRMTTGRIRFWYARAVCVSTNR